MHALMVDLVVADVGGGDANNHEDTDDDQNGVMMR